MRPGVFCFVLFVAIGCVAAVVVDHALYWQRWREQPDPKTQVCIELRPERQVIKAGEMPTFTVTLVNRGVSDVVLVEPGDGSNCGWRTPIVQWSASPFPAGRRCGNINPLTAEEVFTLQPGASRHLNGWTVPFNLLQPGQHRVAMRYSNRPELDWDGIPLGQHDPAAMAGVRASTPISAVSNTVEIVVEP